MAAPARSRKPRRPPRDYRVVVAPAPPDHSVAAAILAWLAARAQPR